MSRTVSVGELAVVAVEPPAAERVPILLLHGFMGGAWYFDRYQELLAERGHPSYALNLRGHHGSRPVAHLGRVSVRDYLDDAMEVAQWLGRPMILGHSMGGLLALKLAEQGAAQAAVLLCAAPPRGIPIFSISLARRQLGYLGPLLFARTLTPRPADLDAIMFNRIPVAERAGLHARFVAESGLAGRELSLWSVPVDPSRVHCPILVVTASEDRFVVPRIARRIARKYHADYREYAGHGHFLLYEPDWETPARDIVDWLAAIPPTS